MTSALTGIQERRRPEPNLVWIVAPAVLMGVVASLLTLAAGIAGVNSPVNVVMAWTVHFFFPEGVGGALLESVYEDASGLSLYGAYAWGAFALFVALGTVRALLGEVLSSVSRFAPSARATMGPLSAFDPQHDQHWPHALVVGDGRSAVASWCKAHAGRCSVVALARFSKRDDGDAVLGSPDQIIWDELLEVVLSDASRRYLAKPHHPQRPVIVVIDLGVVINPDRSTMTDAQRQRLLEGVDELLRIGRGVQVHVLALVDDPDDVHRLSPTVQNQQTFHFPRPVPDGPLTDTRWSA